MESAEWVASQTPSAEPVVPAAPAAPVTPSADPSAASSAPPQSPAIVPTGAAPASPTTPEAIAEFIEAQLDGKPYKLPAGLQFPWKVGKESGFATWRELQQGYQTPKAIHQRGTELGERRRAFEEQSTAWERTKVEEEARWKGYQTEREYLMKALNGDEAAQQHLQLMQTDPEYAKRFERSLDADAFDAIREHDALRETETKAASIAADARDYIREIADKHPGVDPQRVTQRYAEAWTALDQMTDEGRRAAQMRYLSNPRSVDDLFKQEAAEVSRVTGPMQAKLDEVLQELAALKAEAAADKHNTRTAARIAATKGSAITAPSGAAPAPSGPLPTPPMVSHTERAGRSKAWVAAH